MAHESFEDPATAAEINAAFVAVKVDREERPDVDAVYMEAVQAMSGRGGWPMTVFLTPDGRPFFAGTYFPTTRHARDAGLPPRPCGDRRCLEATTRRDREAGRRAVGFRPPARRPRRPPAGEHGCQRVPTESPDKATARTGPRCRRDSSTRPWPRSRHATTPATEVSGPRPSSPRAPSSSFACATTDTAGDAHSLAIAVTTLEAMAAGGIYDHLGGGFARYSTDDTWTVPHFEKMLYDQAGLVLAYLHAWQLTHDPRFIQVVDETVEYVLRDLAGSRCRRAVRRRGRRLRRRGGPVLHVDPRRDRSRPASDARVGRDRMVRSHRERQLRGQIDT